MIVSIACTGNVRTWCHLHAVNQSTHIK